MKMEMYWSQQEVFLMGILSLFPEKLTKELVITLDREWYYFNSKTDDELAQQLYEYKKAGYIEFEEVPLLVKYIDKLPNPDDESNFRPHPRGFSIHSVNSQKATDDLTQYLKNWCSDKLLTNEAHKPDDYKYQHEKILIALKRAYASQSMPRINGTDVYGNPDSSFYNYQPPFWEAVLAPQLVNNQYTIRQMDYDLVNDGQPFVDIKITNTKLRHSLKLLHKQSSKQNLKAKIFISDERIVYVELGGSENQRISRKLRTDSSRHSFMNYMLSHPRSRISYADIEIATDNKDITELVRGCGFDKSLKKIFFPGTTEKAVFFDPSPIITATQAEYIKKFNWDKVGNSEKI